MNPRLQTRISAAISRACRKGGAPVKVYAWGSYREFNAVFMGESDVVEGGRVGSVGSRGFFVFSFEEYDRLIDWIGNDEEDVRLVDGSTEWEIDFGGLLAKESEGVIVVSAYRIVKER